MQLIFGDDLQTVPAVDESPACRFATRLEAAGPKALVENADVRLGALVASGGAMPFTLSDPGRAETIVASVETAYARAAAVELAAAPGWGRVVARFVGLLGGGMRWAEVDRLLLINNWLLTTGPDPVLEADEVGPMTRLLVDAFPDRLFCLWRVNPRRNGALIDALSAAGYAMLPLRTTYVFDPSAEGWKPKRNVGRDRRLADRFPDLCRFSGGPFTDDDCMRMANLYRRVYVDRHSRFNPWFTGDFIRLLADTGLFRFAGYRGPQGRIEGFVATTGTDMQISTLIGYDTDDGAEAPMYRMLMSILIDGAIDARTPINLGYGVGRFKMLRGAEPAVEVSAYYARHLPARRRWAIGAMAAAFNGPLRPLVVGAGRQ